MEVTWALEQERLGEDDEVKVYKDRLTEMQYGEGAVGLHGPLIVMQGSTIEPNKNMLAGVIHTPDGTFLGSTTGKELWVGEIILIPQIKLSSTEAYGGYRIDQLLCMNSWAHKDNWPKELWRKG
jgi:hypothetical protein